jgi:hypothetical protein
MGAFYYMKKYNEFELIGLGVSVYLICLIFGIISKHIFGFDVDILSASATLFAAVVAMLLFNDWKEPLIFERIDHFHNKISLLTSKIKDTYAIIDNKTLVCRVMSLADLPYEADELSEDESDEELADNLTILKNDFNSLYIILGEYIVCLRNIDSQIARDQIQLTEEYVEKLIIFRSKLGRIDGILSKKYIVKYVCNTLIKELDLRNFVSDLGFMSSDNQNSFFYKLLNQTRKGQ